MEYTKEKVCPNCGEKAYGDSVFCAKCGTKIDGDVPSIEQKLNNLGIPKKKKKKNVMIAVIVILMVFLIGKYIKISNLKKELMRDWCRVEGEVDAHILCVLDFSDTEIEYRLETEYEWMNTTVATYDYKVISGNKIKVSRAGEDDWKTITIEFSDDKKAMTVSPSLTSIDESKIWFELD